VGGRSYHRSHPGARRPVDEPPVPDRRGEPDRPGPDDPRHAGRGQGSGHGGEFVTIMKILVIGLDCAAPELLLGDDRLENLRRLMEAGCHGRLESIIPPITVPAWMCMATSQDPGSLGVYGFRNRVDHSYDNLGIVSARSIGELALWDQVAREGK